MMQGPGNGVMHGMNMMGPGHPGNHPNMSHGMPGNRPPPPEYHSQQGGQNNMPYMMGAQNSLVGDKMRMPNQMGPNNMNMNPGMNPMMMGGMNMNPGMKQ